MRRTLPRVLSPVEVDKLLGALRTQRDRAIVLAMLLGGLRRCEVLGVRLRDINPGEQRLFVASGKGGRERIVPVWGRFFETRGAYLQSERPQEVSSDAVFVVLKGPRRGMPLSAAGLDEVIDGARQRAGVARLTCHMLRHTCLTRLREQRMGRVDRRVPRLRLHRLRPSWTATSNRSANRAPTSRPHSSFAPPSNANATTPPTKARSPG
ncbi:MAG TPA: tyrosine-type recombinase/integrase [Solirubrobacteraceae bacterium]|nr:tyrosine-type recombinase/integrase [Solirubrobacteraceae bacterium]